MFESKHDECGFEAADGSTPPSNRSKQKEKYFSTFRYNTPRYRGPSSWGLHMLCIGSSVGLSASLDINLLDIVMRLTPELGLL